MTVAEIIELSSREAKEYCSKFDVAQYGSTWCEFEKIMLDKFILVNISKYIKEYDNG